MEDSNLDCCLSVLQGETVPYIICVARGEDGQVEEVQSKGLAERAFHPEEVNGNQRLTVDANYYLANQARYLPDLIYGTDCLTQQVSYYRDNGFMIFWIAESLNSSVPRRSQAFPFLWANCKSLDKMLRRFLHIKKKWHSTSYDNAYFVKAIIFCRL